jgi:hypothetical protein
VFPNDSFISPGVYSGSNGATVDIVQYSGYLFTHQDSTGNILVFSESTLQPSGGASQFLFSTLGVTSFSFSSDTTSCGALGSVNGIGCTVVNNSLAEAILFPQGSFTSVGMFTGAEASVHIVQSTATPELRTLVLALVSIAAGLFYSRRGQTNHV